MELHKSKFRSFKIEYIKTVSEIDLKKKRECSK